MKKEKRNIAHSILIRLSNLRRERKEEYQTILTRFALERFLYRLQNSGYSKQFVLKGAFLFTLWTKQYYRPTKDIDFLADISNQPEEIRRIFKEICNVEVEPDGLVYDSGNISIEEIIEGTSYNGLRIRILAKLQNVRIPLQFDISFGDVVYPSIKEMEYPSLLDFPKPRIRVYPLESIISEKAEAMVDLGIQNSRMKDFYDIYSLIRSFDIEGNSMQKAISATFERRKTGIPEDIPIALTDEFAYDKAKNEQWRQFVIKNGLSSLPETLVVVIYEIRNFLLPIFTATLKHVDFKFKWSSVSTAGEIREWTNASTL